MIFGGTAFESALAALVAALLGLFYIVGLPRDRVLGRVVTLGLALFVAVPTTNLDSADPLRFYIPVAAAGAVIAGFLFRGGSPRGAGATLLLVLVGMTGWVTLSRREPNGESILTTVLLAAGPLALASAAASPRERRMILRAIVGLALVQAALAVAEITVLTEPLYGAPISPDTGLPTRIPNELLGGGTFRAQGTMGHPLPMGMLLALAAGLVGRNSVEWSSKARTFAMGAIFVGAVAGGSRSVLLLVILVAALTLGGRKLGPRIVAGTVVAGFAGFVALSLPFVQQQVATLTGSGSYTHRLEGFASIGRLMSRPDWSSRWFGDGYGSSARLFREGYFQSGAFTAVDNQYVLTLAESGLIGLGLLLALLLIPMLRAEVWARIPVTILAAMALIFDILAWTSTLAMFAVLVPMAWATHPRARRSLDAANGHDGVVGPDREAAPARRGR